MFYYRATLTGNRTSMLCTRLSRVGMPDIPQLSTLRQNVQVNARVNGCPAHNIAIDTPRLI